MLGMILLILGFGFVIFVHELGHFLAAKWVGIRVDQFALGFGQALISYRKGMGMRVGSSGKAYAALEKAAKEPDSKVDLSRYGETEYRFNWIPLGGYVKMLGQDDLNPNAKSADPRSFNSKSIGARMLVVAAGVIMNIIFGTLGFMVLFRMGLSNPPAVVGAVQPFSPAQETVTVDGKPAPLQVGDEILEINGRPQYDFTKVRLAIALAKGDASLGLKVKRHDGRTEELRTTPRLDSTGFLFIGFTPPALLKAPHIRHDKDLSKYNDLPAEQRPLHPGEIIVEASGQSVKVSDFVLFHDILQKSGGKPVKLKVQNAEGQTRELEIQPQLVTGGDEPLRILDLEPRAMITAIGEGSPAAGKIEPGDIVLSASFGDLLRNHPTIEELRKVIFAAGAAGKPLNLTLLRDDKIVELKDVVPNVRVAGGTGLGIGISIDEAHAVVGGAKPHTPAFNIIQGSTLKRVAGQDVKSWHDVLRVLREQQPGKIRVEAADPLDPTRVEGYDLSLTQADLTKLQQLQYAAGIQLEPLQRKRQTDSPLEAAKWGVEETRDFVQQFYISLQRIFEGTVSPKNLMGPVGMVHAGTLFADKGLDSVLWFLAMISANLALVNFLPIPIVDGGLFLFLIIEKIQGKPLSARAQNVAQWIGLSLLLFVFLFATYQDILRFLTMR